MRKEPRWQNSMEVFVSSMKYSQTNTKPSCTPKKLIWGLTQQSAQPEPQNLAGMWRREVKWGRKKPQRAGSCFWWGVIFPYSLPISILSPQKHLPALCSFSLPQFTSPHHVRAEFCGSGCADCCVNPQISFLGVQDGLVLISLYFMDASFISLLNTFVFIFQEGFLRTA